MYARRENWMLTLPLFIFKRCEITGVAGNNLRYWGELCMPPMQYPKFSISKLQILVSSQIYRFERKKSFSEDMVRCRRSERVNRYVLYSFWTSDVLSLYCSLPSCQSKHTNQLLKRLAKIITSICFSLPVYTWSSCEIFVTAYYENNNLTTENYKQFNNQYLLSACYSTPFFNYSYVDPFFSILNFEHYSVLCRLHQTLVQIRQ